jgi:hypothetical protein
MTGSIMISVANLTEAAVAIQAVEAFRSNQNPVLPAAAQSLSPLADRIYGALRTSSFTKPSQVVTQVLVGYSGSDEVPLSALISQFLSEGLGKSEHEAWNRLRAALANLSWLMGQRLLPEDLAGTTKPIDVFAKRSLDQHGKRLYRLTPEGREAAERFFNS